MFSGGCFSRHVDPQNESRSSPTQLESARTTPPVSAYGGSAARDFEHIDDEQKDVSAVGS